MPSSSDSKIRKGSFRPVFSASPSREGLTYGAEVSEDAGEETGRDEWLNLPLAKALEKAELEIRGAVGRGAFPHLAEVVARNPVIEAAALLAQSPAGETCLTITPRIYHSVTAGRSGPWVEVMRDVESARRLVQILGRGRSALTYKKGPYRGQSSD